MSKAGEITDAEYLPGRNVIEYTFETANGKKGTATLSDRPWGPGTVLSENAMRQVADELPGTPLYDRTDGGAFDPEVTPSIGFDPDA